MPDYHAITTDVRFDFAGAAALAADLRGAADLVRYQMGVRARAAEVANEHWRGAYRGEFDDRLTVCFADGTMLVERLHQKATELDGRSADARAEQARREEARREAEEYADRSNLERLRDWVFGGFFPEFSRIMAGEATPNAKSLETVTGIIGGLWTEAAKQIDQPRLPWPLQPITL